jgi:hypothetical protein
MFDKKSEQETSPGRNDKEEYLESKYLFATIIMGSYTKAC